MANENSITFDTEDVSSILAVLKNDVQNLDNIKSNVKSALEPITNCDLFTEGLEQLTKKIESIKKSYEGIISVVDAQASKYSLSDDQIANAASNYMSYYNGGSSSGGTSGGDYGASGSEDDYAVDTVDAGKIISTVLDDQVKAIDDKTLINIINFMNMNKEANVTIRDILNEINSKALAIYLQGFYKMYANADLTITDETIIRKEFLKCLLNAEVDLPAELKENSILKYKEYLKDIADSKNISLGDLFTLEEHSEIIKTALEDLYDGKVDAKKYDFAANYKEEFVKLVSKITQEKNVSKEEVFKNPLYLV